MVKKEKPMNGRFLRFNQENSELARIIGPPRNKWLDLYVLIFSSWVSAPMTFPLILIIIVW